MASEDANSQVRQHPFYFDTGATSHMCPYPDRFESIEPCSGSVRSSSRALMTIKGKGAVVMDCVLKDGSVSSFRVRDVLFVPELERPLLSWKKIQGLGYMMIGEGDTISIVKNGKTTLQAVSDGSLFKVPEKTDTALLTYDYWHQALGHLGPSSMEKAKHLYADANVIPSRPANFHCDACSKAKQTRSPRSPIPRVAREKLDLIHTDLCGPFPSPSYGGSLYYITFVDDATRATWVRFLKRKSDTSQCIKDLVKEMETQHGKTIKAFRSDNGGEYISKELMAWFNSKGILHEFTPPYSPESNGVAERINRSIGENLRAMLEDLPTYDKRLWAEAVQTWVYLKNRQPHKAVKDQTPYEAFYGQKPTVHHLQPFGRECYLHIPEERRRNKLSPRAELGIFVGYTNVNHHYRVYSPSRNHTYVSADVFFPPLKTEGVSDKSSNPISALRRSLPDPVTVQPSSSSSTDLQYPLNKNGFPTDEMWISWCDRNPEQAIEWFHQGHPKVTDIFTKEYERGRRTGFLGPQYWDYDALDTSPTPPQNTSQPVAAPAPPERTPTPMDTSQSTPTPPTHTPAPAGQHQTPAPHAPRAPPISSQPGPVVTRSGRTVNPPGPWWQAVPTVTPMPTIDDDDEPMPDAPAEQDEDLEVTLISFLLIPEPRTYRQAQQSPDWPEWRKAMDKELQSLEENDVWEVVPRPANRRVVACKWVFKVKANSSGELERFKARLVAKGFSQTQGEDFDEIFSPVVRYDSLRLLLAISASKGWHPRQLDVTTAFLYGILKEEVYMHLPEGSRKDGMVARLKRCIYGLKQSPREWYFRLVEHLIPYGFAITVFDPCVLVHSTGELFIAVYVDDITLFGESGSLLDSTIALLKSEFKVNDMGPLHWLLGIQIDFNDAGITLSQSSYIDKLLDRFSMQNCNPISTPVDANHRLTKACDEDSRVDANAYQQIIGSLMYLVTATRPDLAYTIAHLSQFNSDPTTAHMAAAKRVIRYLQATKERKLFYPWRSPLQLDGYSDSSYANCLDTRRSFSGYVFKLGDSTISWRCRKQKSVATSTCEAEYMAISNATKHYLWTHRGIKELLKNDIPNALHVDSLSALDLASNPKINDRSKHIDVAYHFIRELVEAGTVTLLHVAGTENIADICTKGLPRPIHEYLCTKIFDAK